MMDRSRSRTDLNSIIDYVKGRTSGGVTSFRSMAYGNSIYVGLSLSGGLYSSANGIAWTSLDSAVPEGVALASVKYISTQFVAVGSKGSIYTSTNGTTWTASTSISPAKDLHSICYGDNLYVISANRGIVYTGASLSSLTASTAGASFFDMTFGAHLFVGINGDEMWTSSNGVSWTRKIGGSGNDLTGTAFYSTMFWFVGSGGAIYKTNNFTDWEICKTVFPNNWQSICRGATSFLISGDGDTNISSTTGENWNKSLRTYSRSDLRLRTWSFGILPCESDLDVAFKILDSIPPPGLIVLADESHSTKTMGGGSNAWGGRESKLTIVLFTRRLSTPEASVVSIQGMEDRSISIFDYQMFGNALIRYSTSKGFPINRWSGIVATKMEFGVEDSQIY
jgi:hypothetical protein